MFKSILFTVFSLVCLSGSFINARPVSRSDIHSGVMSVLSEMGSTIDSMKKMHSAFVSMADDASNALCAAAAKEAAGNITADCSVLFTNGGSIDLSKFASLETIGAACTNTFSNEVVAKCALTFTTRYQSAIKVCDANNATDVTNAIVVAAGGKLDVFANLTGLVTLGNAICTKNTDGSYCIAKLVEGGVTKTFEDLSKVNNTVYNAICTDCTKKLMNALAAAGAASNDKLKPLLAGLQFVCTTDPTNSATPCMDSVKILIQFKGKASNEISAMIQAMTETDINIMCSPCTMSVINSIGTIAPLTNGQISDADVQSIKGARSAIKTACVRDPQKNNAYCPALLREPLKQWAKGLISNQATIQQLGSCTGLALTPPTCSAECSGAISQLLSSYSCCLGLVPLASLANYLPTDAASATITGMFAKALTACAISPVVSCAVPTTAVLPVTFVLNNVRYTWATGAVKAETKTAFETALKSDIASAFSLDLTAVTIGQITSNANGGVIVTVQLSIDSNVANGYRATIQSRIEASMSFAATTAEADKEPQSSKVDQTKGVQADPQASTVGGASGAIAAKSIIGAVFVTIASLIAMKFY